MVQKNLSIITKKDILILRQLLEDGRKSSSSISKEIDLGREIVNYRIKRLIKENLIVKFIPKINENFMHYREYNILIKLNLDDEISKDKFIRERIGNKYLIWIIKSSSGWDLMVRLYASNIDEFKEKLKEILDNFSNYITNYYTIITSDEIKENEKKLLCEKLFNQDFKEENNKQDVDYNVIKSSSNIQIDSKDKEIIELLEENGRIQYKEIADKLSISSDTVKYRIDKLKNYGIIENFTPIINFNKIGMIAFAGIIKFKFLNKVEEEKLKDLIINSKFIIKAIKSLNLEEYFLNLVFENENEIELFKKLLEKEFGDKIERLEFFRLE